MDPRFSHSDIFNRRRYEWNNKNVRTHIDKLFSKVQLIKDWKYKGSNWVKGESKRNVEIKNTKIKTLHVVIEDPKQNIHEFDIKIPQLINNQFLYIGGYLKIPIFQLFDHPLLYKSDDPIQIRFRTNILTFSIIEKNGKLIVNLFDRKINLPDLIVAMHTREEFDEFFDTLENKSGCTYIKEIYKECHDIWNNTTEEQRIKKIGSLFSSIKNDEDKKGKSILFSLKSAFEIDYFNQSYMKTNSFMFETLQALSDGIRSDTDLKNKRVRLSEYILSPLIRKVYDMIISYYNHKYRFKIPKTIILEKCNVSDIIHYNFSINPVAEIASMCQLSLTGPGGFKKNNVPTHLRALDNSHFGFICPADTPDRDGCGVILNMTPTIHLDKNGGFEYPDDEIIISYPISLTPFLANDDQTRLQMSSNQMKQTIILKNSEPPIIKSGVEDAYLDNSTFIFRAKEDGIVIYVDTKRMIVKYDSGELETIDIYYKTPKFDCIRPHIMEGRFKRNDILAQSLFVKNGELSLGKNLLTGITIWKGYNYEDSIVISQSVADNCFTSIHEIDLSFDIEPNQLLLSLENDSYIPLPPILHTLKKGEVYAKIKNINKDALETVNISPIEKTAPDNCKIVNIEFFINKYDDTIGEYKVYINNIINKQFQQYENIKHTIYENVDKDKGDKFFQDSDIEIYNTTKNIGKYSIDKKKIKGIHVKIHAIQEKKIEIGDKIANRHGNKGIIGLILPDDKMPTLKDGRKLDIIINPLGVISRMNVGQIYEMHLSENLYQLKLLLTKLYNNDCIQIIPELLDNYLNIVDVTEDKWIKKHTLNLFYKKPSEISLNSINNITLIQPAFQSVKPLDLLKSIYFIQKINEIKINELTSDILNNIYLEIIKDDTIISNLDNICDRQELFDPETQEYIHNPICYGYIYFLKLVHRAEEKVSARSIGPYSNKTLQPLGGRSSQGGHRLGEMEVWSLLAYDAMDLLKSFLTVHSDSSGLKNRAISDILQNDDLKDDSDIKPVSLALLESNMNVLGIKLKNVDESDDITEVENEN